ncbi:Flp pilus assembly protein CpaB [Agrococcus sp. DT81.2]|uniref:Flp pilus assembly protein CpaB n=1 Tax=Agrococcus sp. DT81.2 TaxID=3393414 RepID=UPI003CE5C4F0
MIRRIVVALIALLVAAVGGVLTFLYAQGADERAMAELAPQQVLVVAEPIPAGTPSESIARSLTIVEIPAAAVVPGGVTDLADVEGLLTSADLHVGEQLLTSRFLAPEAVNEAVEVPADMHQLSLQLETRRVIGGELRPGDTVGVFLSGTVTSGTSVESESMDLTHLILHKVLVTAVKGAAGVVTNEDGDEVEQGAADSIMVTLALSPADAEQVVFGMEFGNIWLSLEGPDVPEEGTRTVSPTEAFQ